MKKIISIIAALVIIAGLFTSCNVAPKAKQGSKSVTIEVVMNDKTALTKTYKTDLEFLVQLLREKKDELGATISDSSYGAFVEGMNNYKADSLKKEFFEVYVNDVSSMVGVSDIPLEDTKVYKFKLATY